MYTAFFGLKEIPFSIAPNPHYLFMSDRHREALSHLTHGLGDTGGFVLLTGEVGTGKTTISRCLMEQLPDNVQSAFILNPTLSSQELLATICDELKVKYRKTGATLKTLTDKIQEKLLQNHQNNINTLLIIDEAQHLQPEVLEQLRLLTNLETNTKKLLQVILIGQPELQQLLRRRDLRQLAQRITARYHLLPLTKVEVALYIKHRLSVAECYRPIFNRSAVTAIHKISQGIPRLINLLCDRSLSNAYNSNDAVVNKKIVIQSSIDALGEEYSVQHWWQTKWALSTFALSSLSLMLLAGFWWGQRGESISPFVDHILASSLSTTSTNTPANPPENGGLLAADKSSEQVTVADNSKLIEPQVDDINSEKIPAKLIIYQDEHSLGVNNTEQVKLPAAESRIEQKNNDSQKVVDENIEEKFNVNAVEGVSNDLLTRFQDAINEVDDVSIKNVQTVDKNHAAPSLTDMPEWVQKGVPRLNFDMHIYASDGAGWVRVNGRDRYEGDKISEDLFISEIQPQKIILSYRGERFSLAALSSW